MNITDVEDKIIKRANEQNKTFTDVARKYESSFFKDMESLGIQLPLYITRVSEHIPEIIEYIQNIIKSEMAYIVNGSVYFNSSNFKQYGQLVPVSDMEIEEGIL